MNDREGQGRTCRFWVKWVHWSSTRRRRAVLRVKANATPFFTRFQKLRCKQIPRQRESVLTFLLLTGSTPEFEKGLLKIWMKICYFRAVQPPLVWTHGIACLMACGIGVAAGLVQDGAWHTALICSTWAVLSPSFECRLLLSSVSEHLLTLKWPE